MQNDWGCSYAKRCACFTCMRHTSKNENSQLPFSQKNATIYEVGPRGRSLMAEHQLPKLNTGVRFPSPAPPVMTRVHRYFADEPFFAFCTLFAPYGTRHNICEATLNLAPHRTPKTEASDWNPDTLCITNS